MYSSLRSEFVPYTNSEQEKKITTTLFVVTNNKLKKDKVKIFKRKKNNGVFHCYEHQTSNCFFQQLSYATVAYMRLNSKSPVHL